MNESAPHGSTEKQLAGAGERARELAAAWLKDLTYESSNGGERGLMVHHVEQFSAKLAPLLAGVLAAVRLEEARAWDANAARPQRFIPFSEIVCWAEERIAALERAVEGK